MNETNSNSYDVLVVGGGQAGLTAAITAAELGASVCVLEAAAIPGTLVISELCTKPRHLS